MPGADPADSSVVLETEVLVVGAGPVGSALAVELGLHGIGCVVVERRTGRSAQPRAKFTNIRTMTLLRRWGVADSVRAGAPLPPGFPSDIAFVTRLLGWELTRFANALSTSVDRSKPFPEPGQQVPQWVVEDRLRECARGFPGVALRSGFALESFAEVDGAVIANVADIERGSVVQIRAKYLAAADGSRSRVREQLGIEMVGVDLAANAAAVFRAPALWSLNDKDRAVQYWTVTPDAAGVLGPLDASELWWYHLNEVAGDGTLSDEEMRRSFFAATGATFDCEVIANGPWLAERRIASRYRQGRAFLLGDAAHLHPPTGGYGMNMGIGDAVDLGWKLAAVLRGWGGETLLESYELERRPIHRRVIDEAAANYAASPTAYRPPELERDGPDADAVRRNLGATIRAEKSREWASIGVQLGYRYDSSPIIVADGTEPTPDEVGEYVPTARPGHLAPHAWIDERRCVYDLLGREFTLLELGGSGAGARAFASAAEACGVPLSVVTPDRTWLRDLYGADLVLVRPDQHVAWRGDDFEHAAAVVDVVRGAAGRRSSR